MDFHFLYRNQRFVWDTLKGSSNLSKHGVTFETACQVFFDRFVQTEDASVDGEQRDSAIRMTEDWVLLLVVHVQRDGGENRIVSARRATK